MCIFFVVAVNSDHRKKIDVVVDDLQFVPLCISSISSGRRDDVFVPIVRLCCWVVDVSLDFALFSLFELISASKKTPDFLGHNE